MKLVYARAAIVDLHRLRAFIAEHDPDAAGRVAEELRLRIDHLLVFPSMGRRVEQAPDPDAIRDMTFGDYVVRYLVHPGVIVVLRVWHRLEDGRQYWVHDAPTGG